MIRIECPRCGAIVKADLVGGVEPFSSSTGEVDHTKAVEERARSEAITHFMQEHDEAGEGAVQALSEVKRVEWVVHENKL